MSKKPLIFHNHPVELERRRFRCRQLVQKIQSLEFEIVLKCNMCGSDRSVLISDIDRYGLPVRSAMCTACGLIYLVDRLSQAGYQKFYEDGIYREFISLYKGIRQTPQKIFRGQQTYTSTLVNSLSGFLGSSNESKFLLDIGGSTGLVSREFEKAFGYKAIILEPAPEEAETSRKQGLSVEVGSIENWLPGRKFDLILLCRTFEHIFDLRPALENIRGMLAPNGLFFCDIADFSMICAQYGPPQSVTQIDHCFWLSHKYAPQLFERGGFQVIRTFINLPDLQVGYLLKPFESKSLLPIDSDLIIDDIEKYLEYQRIWNDSWKEYYDLRSWAKLHLYKWKKRLQFLTSPAL